VAEVMRRAWAEDAAVQGFLVSHALPGLSTRILSSPITSINGKLVPVDYGEEDRALDTNRASLADVLNSQWRTDRQSHGTPGGDVAWQPQQEHP